MNKPAITQLFIYPIKSMRGIALQHSEIGPLGLKYDRNWMLIDSNGRFLSQREIPELGFFEIEIKADGLLVVHRGDQLFIPLNPSNDTTIATSIWDDNVVATCYPETINRWFADRLQIQCKLVKYTEPQSHRQIDIRYAQLGETTAFSDGYPVLIISQASLDNLNSMLNEPIGIERFRPNIVVNNLLPHQEDALTKFYCNGIEMHGAKPCARCVVTTIDPLTGKSGAEPLKTLATYRKSGNKVNFGNNILVRGEGQIAVGDTLDMLPFT